MKNFKVIVGIGMLACSTLAFAGKTWYVVGAVPEPYAVDSDGFDAEARFISQYNGGLMNGTIQPGDLADVTYADGTIVQFTIGPLFQHGHPFDINKPSKVLQGPIPQNGRPTKTYNVTTGNSLPIVMSPDPGPTTVTWSITINQFDGLPSTTYTGTSTNGGGSAGGASGGTPDPSPCTGDCDDGDQE